MAKLVDLQRVTKTDSALQSKKEKGANQKKISALMEGLPMASTSVSETCETEVRVYRAMQAIQSSLNMEDVLKAPVNPVQILCVGLSWCDRVDDFKAIFMLTVPLCFLHSGQESEHHSCSQDFTRIYRVVHSRTLANSHLHNA